MARENILVVEDDEDIQQLVSYTLLKAGFQPVCADSAEQAQTLLDKESYACMLLDLMLPGMSGLELSRALRAQDKYRQLPIVMLTAKGEENDVVQGLDSGADDYLPKPFSPRVLVARLRAVLRRRQRQQEENSEEAALSLVCGDIAIHLGRHEVSLAGQPLQLTTTEFGILALLTKRPGWVFTRQQIIDAVRGYDYTITPRAVDVQIFGLRKKLGQAGDAIETVRGIGYRLRQ
ncbi:MAG: DNA-binding response regulator [Desulfobulbaceae bacterium A2]|nr:MAG: DNA-binding response regulator [Desulfobulbaceae bacterium A2]